MLLRPGLLEPSDGRGRQPAGVLAKQCGQRLLEVAGGDALEVEDRDQHFEALRPAGVGRQNRRRKADALAALTNTVAHARTAHGDRTNAGHDLAFLFCDGPLRASLKAEPPPTPFAPPHRTRRSGIDVSPLAQLGAELLERYMSKLPGLVLSDLSLF